MEKLAEESPQGEQWGENGSGGTLARSTRIVEGGDDIVGGEDFVERQAVGLEESSPPSVGLLP